MTVSIAGPTRKLVEVALPLDTVSRHASREKSIRHGHPSTLHLWWSRKPLAAARAVLFAQLVDDPASRPDLFPTRAAQDAERVRLLDLVGRLSAWDATTDAALMHQVRQEVAAAVGDDDLLVWDPFAGGGSIPLEGQRLGLPVLSSDLNPVAVLIQRALLEIPRRWRDCSPVTGAGPETWELISGGPGGTAPGRGPVTGAGPANSEGPATGDLVSPAGPATARPPTGRRSGTRSAPAGATAGLATDLRAFGERVLAIAAGQLRPLYPRLVWDGVEREVAAYLWVRTVPCGNPACGADVPMLSNPWLRRRKGQETWLDVRWDEAAGALRFRVRHGTDAVVRSSRGAVFACVACGAPTTTDEVKSRARDRGLGRALRCVVPDAGALRPFLVVDEAEVCPPVSAPDLPDLDLDLDPLVSNAPTYGVSTLADLHLPRQRAALVTFADTVRGITPEIRRAALAAGWEETRAEDYARDLTLLLGLVLGRLANRMSTACIWNAHRGLVEQTFIQNNAIAFPWDHAEANPLSSVSGSWSSQLDWVVRVVARCDPAADAEVLLHDARTPPSSVRDRQVVVSTDPPYFDYFLYSSLSDYFYVWLRRALRETVPELFSTVGTPRHAEIVMRDEGDGGTASRGAFLDGLATSLASIRDTVSADYPITVYYAYRSTQVVAGGVSAWEAFLGAVRTAGLVVTATWPIRTERTEGIKTGTNSLASSIVVVCRRRDGDAPRTDLRGYLAALRERVPPAVAILQDTGISPVDLAQAAIGPGMAVFTEFSEILDTDGERLSVSAALNLVNQVIGESLARQESDLDPETRFCLAWFEQYGFDRGPFGVADGLARAKNTSLLRLERHGVLRTGAGVVQLLAPADLGRGYRPGDAEWVCLWEVVLHLAKRLHEEGSPAAAALMDVAARRVDLRAGKELAYLLYSICQLRRWPRPAALFNGLGTSWNDLEDLRAGGVG
jgi:putative DNA methylase